LRELTGMERDCGRRKRWMDQNEESCVPEEERGLAGMA
jgi:hypothetical protein